MALEVAVGVGAAVPSVALAGIAPGVGGLAVVEGVLVWAHDAGVGEGIWRPPLGVLILVSKRAVLVAVAVLLAAIMHLLAEA